MKNYFFALGFICLVGLFFWNPRTEKVISPPKVGAKVDSLDGVYVYYNGKISHVKDRNVSKDGYNIGLRWQCVEFIKRYYYEAHNHKMPNSYGHAKHFFANGLKDGQANPDRNLRQFTNPSKFKPRRGEIIIFDGNQWNPYGHVAIISKVENTQIEIIQQNPGPYANSREFFNLKKVKGSWTIEGNSILGRLGQ